MPSIHELLDDSQKKCQMLAEEIKAFKDARILHQKATESLEATSKALIETARAIQPFTQIRVHRFTLLVVLTSLLNLLLFFTILLMMIFKK